MKILLGLSGGVDSTCAALKLMQQGHTVEGAVLVMHDYTSVSEAEESAASLGIPLHVLDCREQFRDIVEKNFISEYKNGRTPNPCVICNSEIKFVYLYRYAMEHGFDMIATGHYAKIQMSDASGETLYAISRASDEKKDQTYMLWRIPREILSKLLLPLSEMQKSEVRRLAEENGLSAAKRGDSQEICFIPDKDYAGYIEQREGKSKKGSFVDEDGNILGEHKGIINYTVGQRKGLGISSSARIFVTKIDPVTNTVVLSHNDSFAKEVKVSQIVYSFMNKPEGRVERRLSVKLRYAAAPVMARVAFSENEAVAFLDEAVRAVTPGQSAVFYDGDVLVAGGFIDSAK